MGVGGGGGGRIVSHSLLFERAERPTGRSSNESLCGYVPKVTDGIICI